MTAQHVSVFCMCALSLIVGLSINEKSAALYIEPFRPLIAASMVALFGLYITASGHLRKQREYTGTVFIFGGLCAAAWYLGMHLGAVRF